MPYRIYEHRFQRTRAEPTLTFNRADVTPCRAKAKAFTALEEYLRAHPELPPSGWACTQQVDITGLYPALRTLPTV